MKNLYLLLVIVLSFYFQIGHTQSITDEGNEWRLATFDFMSGWHTSIFKIEGDSIINGVSYKKIIRETNSGQAGQLNFLVREDSTGKVFKWQGFLDTEIMIYDFGAEVGDTITSHYISTHQVMVEEMDSVMLMDGSFRQRQKLVTFDNAALGEEYWIEGIGGLNIAFFDITELWTADGGLYLNCFHHDGEQLLGALLGNECDLILSNHNIENTKIEISPNPTSDQLNIYFSTNDFSSNEKFHLVNVEGKAVKEFEVPFNETTYMLSVADYPSGIYFLQYLKDGASVKTEQIIISH